MSQGNPTLSGDNQSGTLSLKKLQGCVARQEVHVAHTHLKADKALKLTQRQWGLVELRVRTNLWSCSLVAVLLLAYTKYKCYRSMNDFMGKHKPTCVLGDCRSGAGLMGK